MIMITSIHDQTADHFCAAGEIQFLAANVIKSFEQLL